MSPANEGKRRPTAELCLHLGGAGGLLGLLAVAAPGPGPALDDVRGAVTAGDPFGPLVAAVALSAWIVAGWLFLIVLLTAAAQRPGLTGRGAAALSALLAPRAVRRAAELALGLTVAAGTVGCPPAAATPPAPPPPVVVSLDWPGTASPAAAASRPIPGPVAEASAVGLPDTVVQPGDTLWALASARLRAAATDAQVAQAWPRWWAANRGVIGADPDLIVPGMRLTPPA